MRPTRARSPAAIALGVALLAALPAIGQQTGTKPPADLQQRPVFRGGTNVVQVDVYPSRDGRIVDALTAADFELFEDGVRQKIDDLQFIRIEANAIGERVDPNTVEDADRQAADPRNRVFVLFLDHYHINLEGSYRLRRPLVNMLHRLLTPTDLFGVMTPLLRARDLTLARRTETIEALLDRHWAWGLTASQGEPDAEDEWRIRCVEAKYPVNLGRWHTERMFETLDGLAEHLGRIREPRKVLLFFSRGWSPFAPIQRTKLKPALPGVGVDPLGRLTTAPAPGRVDGARCNAEALRLDALDSDEMLRRFLDIARRHNVSVYPVNPSGLETPEVITGGDIQRQFESIRDRWQQLLTIAENTDGIAVGSNDMAGDLRRVVDDVSAYYVLSYTPSNSAQDGKYRRIEVKVRQPGVAVKARRGYFASSAEDPERARTATSATPPAPTAIEEALAVLARLDTGSEARAGRPDATRPSRALVGDAVMSRARSSPRAPLQPAPDRRFRRTERLRVEWPLLAKVDRRDARLLGRDGAPLAVPVSVTEGDLNGQPTVSVDLALAPLGEADYVIELTVGQGSAVEAVFVAFRVVR